MFQWFEVVDKKLKTWRKMRFSIYSEYMIWIFVFGFSLAAVTCYPTGKPERLVDSKLNEEKRFPNGTVVGRYSYTDKDGNPIQVKYFADDSSYGVELKSLKIIDSTISPSKGYYKDENSLKITSQVNPKSDTSDVLNSFDPASKEQASLPFEYANKNNLYKDDKPSTDFDIFYQNELKGPEKCGKEKVHVYFDKDRKIRNILDNFEADKYCEQF